MPLEKMAKGHEQFLRVSDPPPEERFVNIINDFRIASSAETARPNDDAGENFQQLNRTRVAGYAP
jgi:hypothetical protein